jgi:hypothetical protein
VAERAKSRLRRFAGEPLVHFLLVGGLLFAGHRFLAEPDAAASLDISPEFVRGLALEHEQRTGSPPEDEEALVRRFVRDEALYRQALALGLDRNDVIVRRRLIQKMEFLLRSGAAVDAPSDVQLQHYMQSHPERFRTRERVAFTHVFFSGERRDDPRADAEAVRATLSAQTVRAEAEGDPFLHGYAVTDRSVPEIARQFGDGFAAAIRNAPLNAWHGPVESAFGQHLVRVSARREGALPELSQVHRQVAEAWADERRAAALERATDALVERLNVRRTP